MVCGVLESWDGSPIYRDGCRTRKRKKKKRRSRCEEEEEEGVFMFEQWGEGGNGASQNQSWKLSECE